MKNRNKLREAHRQKLIEDKLKKQLDKVKRLEILALKKEYKNASSNRQREIRIILGTATLKDLLGNAMPIKICKHCCVYAMTDYEASLFHGHSCSNCTKLLRIDKTINIVGQFSFLRDRPKYCKKCGSYTNSFHSDNYKVCNICLGKDIVLPDNKSIVSLGNLAKIEVVINDVTYSSMHEASVALGIPYNKLRYQVIQGKL